MEPPGIPGRFSIGLGEDDPQALVDGPGQLLGQVPFDVPALVQLMKTSS
jgi:hypothetical protein